VVSTAFLPLTREMGLLNSNWKVGKAIGMPFFRYGGSIVTSGFRNAGGDTSGVLTFQLMPGAGVPSEAVQSAPSESVSVYVVEPWSLCSRFTMKWLAVLCQEHPQFEELGKGEMNMRSRSVLTDILSWTTVPPVLFLTVKVPALLAHIFTFTEYLMKILRRSGYQISLGCWHSAQLVPNRSLFTQYLLIVPFVLGLLGPYVGPSVVGGGGGGGEDEDAAKEEDAAEEEEDVCEEEEDVCKEEEEEDVCEEEDKEEEEEDVCKEEEEEDVCEEEEDETAGGVGLGNGGPTGDGDGDGGRGGDGGTTVGGTAAVQFAAQNWNGDFTGIIVVVSLHT
jgi:hypothetical protein